MIVLFERGSAPPSMEIGLSNVFNALGHKFHVYDPWQTPPFDAFDIFSPNLYIGSVINQRDAVRKCLVEFSAKSYATEAIPAGADVLSQKAGKVCPEYAGDVVYVGGYEDNLAEYIQTASRDFRLKIFQDINEPGVRWGSKHELGFVDRRQIADIYASTSCSLAFNNLQKFYDIILSGGFPLADKSIIPNFPFAYGFNCPDTMYREILYFVRENTRETVKSVKRQMLDEVMRNHTYFHRVFDLLNNIKKPRDATRVLEFYYANFPTRK